MISEPAATPPHQVPVAESTVAIAGLVEVHTPPGVGVDSIAQAPEHKTVVPDMAAGTGSTLTVLVVKQPPAVILYVIVAVPTLTPVTTPPVDVTEATPVALLLHVPPATGLLSVSD
jgi:hypothetical protein